MIIKHVDKQVKYFFIDDKYIFGYLFQDSIPKRFNSDQICMAYEENHLYLGKNNLGMTESLFEKDFSTRTSFSILFADKAITFNTSCLAWFPNLK